MRDWNPRRATTETVMHHVSIYGLIDPFDAKFRYVGQTRQGVEVRIRSHLSEARMYQRYYLSKGLTNKLSKLHVWMLDLDSREVRPRYEVLEELDVEELVTPFHTYLASATFQAEITYVQYLLSEGHPLLNRAYAGDGYKVKDEAEEKKIDIVTVGELEHLKSLAREAGILTPAIERALDGISHE